MENNQNLHEAHIKVAIINRLLKSGFIDKNSVIIDEFTVNRYERRADLVVITKQSMVAFEIKSERDSLKRLEAQVKTYSQYFDKVIVVADRKHMKNIVHVLPRNIGIWEFNQNDLKETQRGRKQPFKAEKKESLLKLLTVSELLQLARKNNILVVKAHRTFLIKKLNIISIKTIREFTTAFIAARYRESSDKFLIKVNNNKQVSVEDLPLLSKYKSKRKTLEKQKESLKKLWEAFGKKSGNELLTGLKKEND